MDITLTISAANRATSDTLRVNEGFDVSALVWAFYNYIEQNTKPEQQKQTPPMRPNKQNRIFVGGLDPRTDDLAIYYIFSRHASVMSLVRSDNRTCAFVKFENKKDAEDAIKRENGTRINNRSKMRVEWALPQKNSRSSALRTPNSKDLLECTLDELIKLNMSSVEVKECEIFDWVAEHGDCEYPYS